MKKTLKLVSILIAVLVVVIVGGLSIYFAVQNNQTYYIYDLRIVEPVSNQYGYVYTESEGGEDNISYKSIKNKSVFLRNDRQNRFEIGIYAKTSNNTTNVSPVSSNTDVAKIVYENGSCYVNYIKAGKTTISVSIGTVTDSFVLTVYDEIAENFAVFDDKYYGEFARHFSNEIVSYSDGLTYEYDFEVSTSAVLNEDGLINNDMLRISGVDTTLVESVQIDARRQKLLVKCKAGLETDKDTTFEVQPYTMTEDGKVKALESKTIFLHIVAHTPEFLQMEISATPDFEEKSVFVDTVLIDPSEFDEDATKEELRQYLAYKKAEQNLESRGENAVYQTFFTSKVNTIYLRFRKVYTNGEVVYISESDANNPVSVIDPSGKLKISSNKNYYILNLSKTDLSSGLNITLTLGDENRISRIFKFEYKDFTSANISLFYDYVDGAFVYKYWDERTHFANEIYENGRVVGFAGLDTSAFETAVAE